MSLENQHKVVKYYCEKCEKLTKHWVDDVCSICRTEPPESGLILIDKMNSILGHLQFYTIIIVISIIIWILTAIGIFY